LKVLLDTCVWGGAVKVLRSAGHGVVWSGEWKADPGDVEILASAHSEGRVLVTLDKDFGELAVVRKIPHSGIIRLVNFPARQQGSVCLKLLACYGEELLLGAIITADSRRVRIRPPYTEEH
jgi:predicted nuclease of predicted toxin-antitoxin system